MEEADTLTFVRFDKVSIRSIGSLTAANPVDCSFAEVMTATWAQLKPRLMK